jgi:hypothetical protein
MDDDETDDEIERILATELFDKEYQGSGDDQAMVLSLWTAKRIIKSLAANGYIIRKSAI